MSEAPQAAPKKFYRTTRTDCKISGVCGGIARYFGWDPTLVRVLWVVITIISAGLGGIIGYIVFAVATPGEDAVGPPPAAPAPGPAYR
jgi:phage shock protein C